MGDEQIEVGLGRQKGYVSRGREPERVLNLEEKLSDKTLLDYRDFVSLREGFSNEVKQRINLSPNAKRVFEGVYTRFLEDGSKEDVYTRIASIAIDVASAEMNYLPKDMPYSQKLRKVEEVARGFLDDYISGRFRANTPTNLNMGRWNPVYDEDFNLIGHSIAPQMGSACFVVPIEDTLGKSVESLDEGILEASVTQQHLHKLGGGTGFSLERLRPAGSVIGYDPVIHGMKSVNWDSGRGVSSGPSSFLTHLFNESTNAIMQGNSRRGANMGIQRIDHQDFLHHMYAKVGTGLENEIKLKNFNLSLAVTDEFMEAALKGDTYTLYNPHRAQPRIKKYLEEKLGIKNPEIVRREDIATREQFEKIMRENKENPLSPRVTPSMYLDDDGMTVINAYTGREIGLVVDGIVRIDARKVLDEHMKLSHSNGEPGMVFLDRMNEYNSVLFSAGSIEATNPCGEQPLLPNEACNLGSINAGGFVRFNRYSSRGELESELEESVLRDPFTRIKNNGNGSVEVVYFDWESLEDTIRRSTRFLDNVIDRSDFPSDRVTHAVRNTRKIGLGYMGVADAMVLMKMRYGSEESLVFAEKLAKKLYEASFDESVKLACERGTFPAWKGSAYDESSKHHQMIKEGSLEIPDRFRGSRKISRAVKKLPIEFKAAKVRNACRTTQAPTGTIRRVVGQYHSELENLAISSGIEPIYSLVEFSRILNSTFEDYSYSAVMLLEREGLDSAKIMKAIKENGGSAHIYSDTPEEAKRVLEEIPEDVREVLVTAAAARDGKYEISPEDHLNMLVTFQRWNDSAISKTVNLPSSFSPEGLRDFWVNLWKNGAKGGTVYVDKSRKFQILHTSSNGSSLEQEKNHRDFRRTLAQRSFTFEVPYSPPEDRWQPGSITSSSDSRSIFTTITYEDFGGDRKRLTGVFQSVHEVDPEKISLRTAMNTEISRAMKNGRSLDQVISDMERQAVKGTQLVAKVDEGVLQIKGSDEISRYQIVTGGTSVEALLASLYFARYLTGGEGVFEESKLSKRWDAYKTGKISFRSIINTKGKIDITNESQRPSILGSEEIISVDGSVPKLLCPECD